MNNLSDKKFNLQGHYTWVCDDRYEADEYANTIEEAVEQAKKQIADGERDVVVIAQRVAIVRDKNKTVTPDIEVVYE